MPRGLRDVNPEESEAFEIVRSAFTETSRIFDYKIMEPSSLELLETLEAKSGPAIRDEIYFFKDKSDRELGLRFDLTVGITRYVTSKRELAPPVRFGSFGSVWRYDEPQYGKYRWFYQWDIELFGPSNAEADAEVIEFAWNLFRRMGTDPKISIGSRKILEAYVTRSLGISELSKTLDAMRAVDKLSKKSFDQIAQEYSASFSKEQFQKLVDFVKLSGDASKVANALKEFRIESNSLLAIIDSLKSRGVVDVELNLSIVRGIDYYTDMVFEAFDKTDPRLGALCGGGRYDSLPAVYGRSDLGATGVAGGVERAILAHKFKKAPSYRIFVAAVKPDLALREKATSIAAELRREGFAAQSDLTGRTLRKILETQSAGGTRAVVLVGEKELAANSVKVRWMSTGEEVLVSLPELRKTLEH
ncbi:MAG: histidine--tRNA ligase [Thaumarchaeota archaeon]|nr:histidine--tRNA ligase [Nitrososphaerota archaeon]